MCVCVQQMERRFTEHTRTVNRVAWKPYEADILLSGSQDGSVKVWDIRKHGSNGGSGSSGQIGLRKSLGSAGSSSSSSSVSTFHCQGGDEVRDVRFSSHYPNYFAAGTDSGSVFVWDMRRQDAPLKHISAAHRGLVLSIDWHPTNRSLLASAGRDRVIKVWDLNDTAAAGGGSGGRAGRPFTHIQTIASIAKIAWRPSGGTHYGTSSQQHHQHHHGHTTNFNNHIASSATLFDTNVHIWDTQRPYTPYRTLKHHKDLVTGIQWLRVQLYNIVTAL